MIKLHVSFLVILVFITKECNFQELEGSYKGKYIGDFNTYANQVSGEVYAVDEWTLLMVNFFYNGEGKDTYFWGGESGRSGPQGFMVPDEYGTTNILERYNGSNSFALTLPEGKRISRIKWLAVFDIDTSNVYGDVFVPEGFEPPAPRTIGSLAGSSAISSNLVKFLDAKTFIIPELRYDGSGEEVYFWTGVGPQPSPRGQKIPDEHGYLEPIRKYNGEDITLILPGALTAFDVQWIAIYDVAARETLASVSVPEELNVPASLLSVLPYRSSLPRCRQLHRDYQVSWEVFGSQITVQLAAQIRENDYMAFGISGSEENSQMVGGDVTVAWFDRVLQRGLATDYNITDKAPCVQVLGQWRGVCRDSVLGGQDSNQVLSASVNEGVTVVTYRRTLMPGEAIDRTYPTDRMMLAVWALGALDFAREPGFHYAHNKHDLMLNLTAAVADSDCVPFTQGSGNVPEAWDVAALTDPALRVFHFKIGDSSPRRGLAARRGRTTSPVLSWLVNGQLAPDIQLRRGLTYTFKVYGGNDPHSASEYHPLIVSDSPEGGLERLSEGGQRAVRVLAGVHQTRRSRLTPTAAGGLCAGRATTDRRRSVEYTTFRAYNRTLQWECTGQPADLVITPNNSWPDLLYYSSFTHAGMGGRIIIVDRLQRSLQLSSSATSCIPSLLTITSLFVLIASCTI